MAREAREAGFSNVHDYLVQMATGEIPGNAVPPTTDFAPPLHQPDQEIDACVVSLPGETAAQIGARKCQFPWGEWLCGKEDIISASGAQCHVVGGRPKRKKAQDTVNNAFAAKKPRGIDSKGLIKEDITPAAGGVTHTPVLDWPRRGARSVYTRR